MHQCRGLQGVVPKLIAEHVIGDLPQVLVDMRKELIDDIGITSSNWRRYLATSVGSEEGMQSRSARRGHQSTSRVRVSRMTVLLTRPHPSGNAQGDL